MKDINLMPDKAKFSKQEENSKERSAAVPVKGIIVTVAAAILVGITLLIPRVQIIALEQGIEKIMIEMRQRKYTDIRALRGSINSLDSMVATKQNIIKSIDSNSLQVTTLFHSVKQAVPEDCYISRIEMDKNKLLVSGIAADSLKAAEFLANLERLDQFSRSGTNDSLSVQNSNSTYKFSFVFNIGGEGVK